MEPNPGLDENNISSLPSSVEFNAETLKFFMSVHHQCHVHIFLEIMSSSDLNAFLPDDKDVNTY